MEAPTTPIPGRCGQPLRGGSFCAMDPDHRGRHTSVVHGCDVCDKYRRGATPHVVETDQDGDVLVQACYFCAVIDEPRQEAEARRRQDEDEQAFWESPEGRRELAEQDRMAREDEASYLAEMADYN